MIELLDRQESLTANQWKIFVAALLSTMLDFFDFFLISFVLAFIFRDWHLTYGQSAAVLFSSGIAAVPAGWFFGWLGDRIGRRKVFITTILIFSFATGVMAFAPSGAWLFLTVMRFIVGLGVGGMTVVDQTLLQEFVPARKRGFIAGLSLALLPAGTLLASILSSSLGPVIGWRGLFAIGLLPAGMAFVIRMWVPESPRWLVREGRLEEARRSLAWALQIDPAKITLPTLTPAPERTSWLELFRYPRSIAVSCLTGLAQTGSVGLQLWLITLLVLVLKKTPAEASFLAIWINLIGMVGRVLGAWMSDALGRRVGGMVTALASAVAMWLAGYLYDQSLAGVSVFYLLLLVQSLCNNSNLAVVFPYMAEVWPASLRASGFGLAYGTSNLGKFIGPAGLAVIAGASNLMSPGATVAAIVPAFGYFASWYVLGALVFIVLGIETRGRTFEELDRSFKLPRRQSPTVGAVEG
ncbi:MAG TPA: MFS transporter [Stellaceae bacterium]|nr:MFS transporter [Stellaceae bacterium]